MPRPFALADAVVLAASVSALAKARHRIARKLISA
jgi:hypothetical protein